MNKITTITLGGCVVCNQKQRALSVDRHYALLTPGFANLVISSIIVYVCVCVLDRKGSWMFASTVLVVV